MTSHNMRVKFQDLQVIIVSFYVGTIILGSIHWIVKPPPLTIFSEKSNPVNVLLVKNGWFWTSLIHIISLKVIYRNQQNQALKAIFRWLGATLYWYLITQWCFGPSMIDRVFVWTGGKCQMQTGINEEYLCKKIGGRWAGGHDVSGHCVLLIHASLFLWEEFSIIIYEYKKFEQTISTHRTLTLMLKGILFVWWWMLFMTALYFHNFAENLAGAMFGILYWVLIYVIILPIYARDWMPYQPDKSS